MASYNGNQRAGRDELACVAVTVVANTAIAKRRMEATMDAIHEYV